MKMSPSTRQAYKIYEAFKPDLVDAPTVDEFNGFADKLTKKLRDMYIRIRNDRDLDSKRAMQLREEIEIAWKMAIDDLKKEGPVTRQTLDDFSIDYGG